MSVSRPCSIVVGSGITSLSDYDKVICNFAEMKGYYAEKTWSVFESHNRNTFCERTVCEDGGVSIVGKQNWSRERSAKEKVKETKDIR